MPQKWNNNAISTLSAGIVAGDTTIFIQGAHGTRFPTIAAPDFCYCTLEDASGNIEIVKVTTHGAGSTSLTVTRAQQGTTARSYAIGDLFELRATATEMTAWEADIDNLELTRARKDGDTYTGTHDFSGATAVVLPAATMIGSVSPTELSYLDGVTSSIQTQLNARGLIAGQTWTGTHAFPATVSIGSVSDSEISYLDGVTSAIQTQIDSKGAITGQVWSGTHDFTAGSIAVHTASLTSNDNTAASTAFVQQAAFASYANLPANPGDYVPRALETYASTVAWNPRSNDLANYAAGIV